MKEERTGSGSVSHRSSDSSWNFRTTNKTKPVSTGLLAPAGETTSLRAKAVRAREGCLRTLSPENRHRFQTTAAPGSAERPQAAFVLGTGCGGRRGTGSPLNREQPRSLGPSESATLAGGGGGEGRARTAFQEPEEGSTAWPRSPPSGCGRGEPVSCSPRACGSSRHWAQPQTPGLLPTRLRERRASAQTPANLRAVHAPARALGPRTEAGGGHAPEDSTEPGWSWTRPGQQCLRGLSAGTRHSVLSDEAAQFQRGLGPC